MADVDSSMQIARVQVEEGFLDGLDLRLGSGLNVIIGTRGTGKTSLIELIRFALGGTGFTAEATRRSDAHARAVLGSGKVTVTLRAASGEETLVTRTTAEPSSRATGRIALPFVLSQTEIEALALQSSGRLKLIDGFLKQSTELSDEEGLITTEIRSLTSEISDKLAEIDGLARQLAVLPELRRQISEIKPAEQRVAQASQAAAEKSRQLQMLSERMATLGVLDAQHERASTRNAQRLQLLLQLLQQWGPEETTGTDSVLQEIRQSSNRAQEIIQHVAADLESVGQKSKAARQRVLHERLSMDESARVLRKEIEELQAGAGQIARQSQQLQEQLAQILSLQGLSDAHRRSLANLLSTRKTLLDRLDALRGRRSDLRAAAANAINRDLGPRIHIEIERAGQIEEYAARLASYMRGSGLKYNDLAQALARAVSPRELLEWSEAEDAAALAEAAEIPRDRAARVLAALREAGLSELSTLLVEDDVRLFLLDGADRKPVTTLSMGQRATVILPIVLERRDATLIVDQPEDHIDNAFITDTLIRAVVRRSNTDQIIFATHNANIPVLGNADRVVQLGSDGHRGHILFNAPLNDAASVSAISTLMEGGREAFEKRAAFYGNPG